MLDVTPSVASVAFVAPPVEEAFYGLAGDIVRTIEPHSESDPWAVLIQLLVAFGNAVGRRPHFLVEATRHHMNLYALVVGETSKSRKGTAWGHVARLIEQKELFDPTWPDRILRGLSSGEGLIWHVRNSNPDTGDLGAADKRLLVFESEFAFPLKTMRRRGNTLSEVVRDAWDGLRTLSTLTKTSPARATDPHISIVGHITVDELRQKLNAIELANGFANRFLFVRVRRSKILPMGGSLTEEGLEPLKVRLREARKFAMHGGRIQFDTQAGSYWREAYTVLSEGRLGLVGAITARAEAQVVRLACIYALLDCSAAIRVEHLRAALALWRYCEASAEYIFGDGLGDPVADDLICELRKHSGTGMTETQIRDHFNHHKSDEIDRALALLESRELVLSISVSTGGRPARRWIATEATKATKVGDDSDGSAESADV